MSTSNENQNQEAAASAPVRRLWVPHPHSDHEETSFTKLADRRTNDIPPELESPLICQKMCQTGQKMEDATTRLKACQACKVVFYCGRDCQKQDRVEHKEECNKFKTVREKTDKVLANIGRHGLEIVGEMQQVDLNLHQWRIFVRSSV